MRIDIFYDLVCPWCFIGKRRLDRALAARPRPGTEIYWQPFQLNPGMPRMGMDRQSYLAAKFGGRERAAQVYAMIAETAARDGMELALDRIACTPNTLDAHRLVRLMANRGTDAGAVVEAVFDAYFRQGHDIGRHDVLADIAAECGCPADAAKAFLVGDSDLAAVRAADSAARHMGIQAVPFFVFNRRFALSGAQEPAAFFPLFDLAVADSALAGDHVSV